MRSDREVVGICPAKNRPESGCKEYNGTDRFLGLETVNDYEEQLFSVIRCRIQQACTVSRIRPIYACRKRTGSLPLYLAAVSDSRIHAVLITG